MMPREDRILLDEEGVLSILPGKGLKLVTDGKTREYRGPDGNPDGLHAAFRFDGGLLRLRSEPVDAKGIARLGKMEGAGSVEARRLELAFLPSSACELNKLAIALDFMQFRGDLWQAAKDSFHWLPNIKSGEGQVAGRHTFRSPAAIASAPGYCAALLPDLASIAERPDVERYLDLAFRDEDPRGGQGLSAPRLEYGISPIETTGHVYYKPCAGGYPIGTPGIGLSFCLLIFKNVPWERIPRLVSAFQWSTFASPFADKLLPQTVPFRKYAEYGNGMALQYLWEPGPAADTGGIALTTFRREDGVVRGREYADDIWFHAWFNNMRTAMELAEFGLRMGRPEWTGKAFAIARCLVAAPRKDGIFPTIYAPHDGGWVASSGQGGGRHLYSVPDCSWAALWLRKFVSEYGAVEGADEFLAGFRSFLYKRRNPSGGFPCWVRANTLESDPRLDDSASGALALWFLGEELLAGAVPIRESDLALRTVAEGAEHLLRAVLPKQRFEDFELYYSCSEKPLGYYDGQTEMYGQNTLAMQWCAECFRCAYLLTRREKYLEAGLFCLGLLSFYQQVWDAPFLDFYTFGGFGVMNTDGEWNDARQAQFAETYMNYYDLTGEFEFLRRAVAATRASFALMAIYENEKVCPRNYRGSAMSFEVHGGSAENYGHSGRNERSGQSGFHWGTGSALVAAARIQKRYGDLLVDLDAQKAAGIDGVAVKSASFGGGAIRLDIEALDGAGDIRIVLKSEGAAPGRGLPEIRLPGYSVRHESGMEYTAVKL